MKFNGQKIRFAAAAAGILCAALIFLIGYKGVDMLKKNTVETVCEQLEKERPDLKKVLPENCQDLVIAVFKQERLVQVFADGKLLRQYPMTGFSGVLGPKLREGDRQIPEGIYHIEYLNPNSSFHLSMKISYPNEFDWKYANIENRKEPGSDIFIHGKDRSVGCIPIGDHAIEELFYIVAQKKNHLKNITVICAPCDLRKQMPPSQEGQYPVWYPELCGNILDALNRKLPKI